MSYKRCVKPLRCVGLRNCGSGAKPAEIIPSAQHTRALVSNRALRSIPTLRKGSEAGAGSPDGSSATSHGAFAAPQAIFGPSSATGCRRARVVGDCQRLTAAFKASPRGVRAGTHASPVSCWPPRDFSGRAGQGVRRAVLGRFISTQRKLTGYVMDDSTIRTAVAGVASRLRKVAEDVRPHKSIPSGVT